MNSTETRKFKQAYAQFQRLLKLQGYTDAAISSYGHDSPTTTAMYTQLTHTIQKNNDALIQQLMCGLHAPSLAFKKLLIVKHPY